MVSPKLIGFVLLATLERFAIVNAAPPVSNATDTTPTSASSNLTSLPSSINTQESSSPTLIATANVAGAFNVTGQFKFALQSGTGPVAVSIEVNGLNALNSSAMYSYHIHTNPVSSSGNCSSTLGHLDPLAVTEALICSPGMPKYCQIGDLSGRNGKLNALDSTTRVSYIDDYLRFWPQAFSLLGRSVVIHSPNSTRIACGNITSIVDDTGNSGGSPTFQRSNYTTQYTLRAPPAATNKYQPFNGSTPNNSVLAEITLPFPLPTVQESPNIILGADVTNQTISGNTKSITLPAALNATSSFTYTPGALLPTQDDTLSFANISTNNRDSISNGPSNTSIKGAASSGSGALLIPITILNFFSFAIFFFLYC